MGFSEVRLFCVACGFENREGAAFCLECGTQLALTCATCARALPGGARFCDGCGAKVGTSPDGAPLVPSVKDAPSPFASNGSPMLRDRAQIEGEHRNVTILFVDAVSSTSKSEHVDPEDLHRVIRAGTDKMIEAVNHCGGTVTQFRGDGVMAIFGAPIAHEDSARRAVSAALFMRDALAAYAAECENSQSIGFDYRIGLNTGPVVVGTIGNDLTMDYSAVGDTVNLAARMEQAAAPRTVCISENTERVIAEYFELRDLGALDLKGKAQPVQAFEVVRELPARTRLDASAARGLTPYVGRDEQLGVLRATFEQARLGEGQVVFVTGEAGMGKSRLLLEFRRALGEQVAWHEGRCISWGQNYPYLPLIDVVKSVFNVEDSDDAHRIGKRIEGHAFAWGEAAASAPHLKRLLNMEPDGDDDAADPAERHARLLEALRVLVTQESRRQPMVIVIEDLHWADEQSETALAALCDAAASCAVLLIVTYRPGYAHALGERTYFSHLALRNLPPQASTSMVAGVLQAAGIPPQLEQMIVEKAEGNPFYIEEVSRSLIEGGILRRTNGTYTLAQSVDSIRIPDTIQEVILSRLDRLDRPARDVVQLGSVIGREFPLRLLQQVSSDGVDVEKLLQELKSLELIYEKSYFPELAYMFKHALTQEVALSTLLAERRKAMHRTVAAAIEELYADRIGEHYEALAHHYNQGEMWEKALHYAKLVGARAQSLYAPRAAIEHLTRAIEASRRLDQPEAPLHRARGVSYEAIGEFDAALADYEAALALAQRLNDPAGEWQGHADLGMLWAGRDYSQTGEHFQRAHDIARSIDDEVLIARSLNRLGNWRLNTDHPLEALQHHDEALSIFQKLEDRRGIAESLDFLQMANGMAGDMPAAMKAGSAAEQLYRELGDRQALAGILASNGFLGPSNESATLVPVLMEHDYSARVLGEALQIAREIGWRAGESYAHMQYSMGLIATGEAGDALYHAEHAMRIAVEIGHQQWQTGAWYAIACVYKDIAAYERAADTCERALALAEEVGSLFWQCNIAGVHAIMCADQGDIERARELLRRRLTPDLPSISIGQRTLWLAQASVLEAQGDFDSAISVLNMLGATGKHTAEAGVRAIPMLAWRRGVLHHRLGRIDAAEADLNAAVAQARVYGVLPQLWKALASLAELRTSQGRDHDARASYADSLDTINIIASRLPDEELRTGFLESTAVRAIRNGARAGAL